MQIVDFAKNNILKLCMDIYGRTESMRERL
jgi:hypothetical protein